MLEGVVNQKRLHTHLSQEAERSSRVGVALRQQHHVHVVLRHAERQRKTTWSANRNHYRAQTSRVCRNVQEPSVTTGAALISLFCSTCVRNASAMCRLRVCTG